MSRQNVRVVVRIRPLDSKESLLTHVGPPRPGFGGIFGSNAEPGALVFSRISKKSNRSHLQSASKRSAGKAEKDDEESEPVLDSFMDLKADHTTIAIRMPQNRNVNTFVCDKVYQPSCRQEDMFLEVAKPIIDDITQGYNGTIFAYGQTGSGKTYTMFGGTGDNNTKVARDEHAGIIPRAVAYLFASLEACTEIVEVIIKVSFLEIYLENIYDLLSPATSPAMLRIRESLTGQTYVEGLHEEYVSSVQDIIDLMELGLRNRVTTATAMNAESSRSHALLICTVEQKLKDGSLRLSKLNLADLAGSERVKDSQVVGLSFEEATKINLALSSLGLVINTLSSSDAPAHVTRFILVASTCPSGLLRCHTATANSPAS
jgi:hypothetical protein